MHQLVAGLFVVEARGPHQLKGVAQPMELYRAIRPSGGAGGRQAAAGRGPTPFVGRAEELGLLSNRWERARGGEGQVVLLVGEPGIGKSRLVQEFRTSIANTPHTFIEAAGQQLFDNTPFYAVSQMLGRGLGWRDDESPAERVAGLERMLQSAGMDLSEALPLVAELLDLPVPEKHPQRPLAPGHKRQRLLATLADWVFRTAGAQPTVIVLEDLQWLDPSTLELTEMLVEQCAPAPLMLLCTARTEFQPPWPARAHHAQLALNRLSDGQVRAMVAQLASCAALPADTVETVVERTTGVPLFVEELTRLVLEGGGRHEREIPLTLSDSLMARLDRLGPAKEVAQVASVIGREFSYQLLHAVAPMTDDDLSAALARLADTDLLYARGTRPEATYEFKHALIQDAAYEALLKSRRKELHRQVAQAIKESFPAMAKTQPEVLARHWTDAGEVERALRAWRRAADAARARSAFKESEAAARRGLAIVAAMPESPERNTRELELTLALLATLLPAKGWSAPETVEARVRAQGLAEKGNNIALLFNYLLTASRIASEQGDYQSGLAMADQCFDIAKREANPFMLGFARLIQIVSHAPMGHFVEVEEHFAQITEFLDGPIVKPYPDVRCGAYYYASYAAYMTGHADSARARMRRAIALARESTALELADAQSFAAMLYVYLREPQEAEALATQALALHDEGGFTGLSWVARVALGWAQAQLGRAGEAAPWTRQALESSIGRGHTGLLRRHRIALADGQGHCGALSEALDTIEEALRPNAQPPSDPELALGLWVRGQLRLKQERIDLAETDFRQAIAVSQRTSAKTLALRAATALGRILRSRGDIAAARDLLAPLYASFTEGFDTLDLIEAKELLQDLGKPA